MFEIIPIEQRTPEWHEFRLGHVTASDAPVIMGVSPRKSIHQLWLEKCMIEEPSSYISPAMQRGIDLEPIALESFITKLSIIMAPCVVKSKINDFMAASLDGLCALHQDMVEIKCPGNENHVKALSGKIQDYYYAQIQHQLAVTGLPFCYYYSFDGVDGIALKFDRDEGYIKELINKEKDFWYCVQNFVEPDCKLKDYQYIEDEECEQLALKLLSLKNEIKEIERQESQLQKQLTSRLIQNSVIGKVKATKIIRVGSIDYSLIPQLKEVDLNHYRKKSTEYWKLEAI